MARLATRLMLGEKMADLNLKDKIIPHHGAKEAVLPFEKFPGVDTILGPEMRSTGEVLGLADNFPLAFYKAEEAANSILPSAPVNGEKKTVLISLSNKDNQKSETLDMARAFSYLGFRILATDGTNKFLNENGIKSEHIAKIGEGRPNVLDVITNNEVCLVVNTPGVRREKREHAGIIRKSALRYKIPYITTLAGAKAAVDGIGTVRNGKGEVKSLQDYHAQIK